MRFSTLIGLLLISCGGVSIDTESPNEECTGVEVVSVDAGYSAADMSTWADFATVCHGNEYDLDYCGEWVGYIYFRCENGVYQGVFERFD